MTPGFTPKDWENAPSTATPISEAALEDVETRLAAYTTMLAGTDAGIFNVKDYGAAGDGIVDDQAECQAAITACVAAGGGIVLFPAGIYNCSSDLDVGDDVTLLGMGQGISIIKLTSSTWRLVGNLDTGSGNDNITVRSLTLDGNNLATTSVLDFRAQTGGGVEPNLNHNIRVEDCEVTRSLTPNGVLIHMAETYGGLVIGCHLHDSDRDGIQFFADQHVAAIGNRIHDIFDDCISFCSDASGSQPNICQFCVASGNDLRPGANSSGVCIAGAKNVSVTGNVIKGGYWGMTITCWDDDWAENVTVSGNSFRECGTNTQSHTTGGGLEIRPGWSGRGGTGNGGVRCVSVSGNTFYDTNGHVIDVTSNGANGLGYDLTIAGNTIRLNRLYYANGINIDMYSDATGSWTDVLIIGNTIADIQTSGIHVDAYEADDMKRLSIIGNNIRNTNINNWGEGMGIRLDCAGATGAVTEVIISDNRVFDTRNPKQIRYALCINGGANMSNLRVSGNDWSGGWLTASIVGLSDVASVGGDSFFPYSTASSKVVNKTLWIDSADGKLKWKDGSGNVQVLY